MATKKPARQPVPAPEEARPESDAANVDSDVERSDRNAPPAPSSVETLDPATPRVDIEHGGLADGDVERGSR